MSARVKTSGQRLLAALATLTASVLLLAGCERPPMVTTQQGFRGTAMQNTENPRIAAAQRAAIPPVPEDAPAPPPVGPKARDIYKNVPLLGDLSVADFNRHMAAITAWVAPPAEGCNYCHIGENFADDSKYQKVISRKMIEMTRAVNGGWKQHVAETGVTCYTCHRGQPVPANVWFKPETPQRNVNSILGNDFGQNRVLKTAGLTSLPYDPYSLYLLGDQQVKVYGKEPLPQGIGNGATILHTEQTYALMMHFSKGLGVNCTFCHNSQSFQQWVSPKKVTAWHGIRMERDINVAHMVPLTDTFPANRKGPTGDVAKVYCATCHQGVNKPLGGLQMAKNYAGLQQVALTGALPAPLVEPTKTVLYFGVGSSALATDQSKGLEQIVATLGAQRSRVAFVSGYHSASGELAANQELAKQRAFSVRDALVAAGVPAARVQLDKPQQTEANIAGEDPSARRVEVTLR
jgi:photosynthetic reaction center cytochrome c subunit